MKAVEYEARISSLSVQKTIPEFDEFEADMFGPAVTEQATKPCLLCTNLLSQSPKHKQTHGRIERINSVFRTVFEVKRIMAEEERRDPVRLLMRTCRSLVADGGYLSARIVRTNGSESAFGTVEACLSHTIRLRAKWFQLIAIPECCLAALRQPDVVTLRISDFTCGDCYLMRGCSNNFNVSVRLESDGKICGVLSVTMPDEVFPDDEEQVLIKELAGIISRGISSLKTTTETVDPAANCTGI